MNVLESVINIDKELKNIGIEKPHIAVAALNPHGGDILKQEYGF